MILLPPAASADPDPSPEELLLRRLMETIAESGMACPDDLRVLTRVLLGVCRAVDVDPVSYVASAAAASDARDARVN